MKPETILEYVIRKLNDRAFNIAEASRRTGIARSTLSELAAGKSPDPAHSTIEKLYNHFQSLAD